MKSIQVISGSNNFTFYDNANGTILRGFEGFEYADVRDVIEDIAGDRGALYVTSRFGRRRFSWTGDLVGSTIFTLRRQMLSAMRQTGQLKTIKFVTYDDLALQCQAEIVKVLNPYTHKVHTYLIEAIAPDWRFYSQTEDTESVAPATSETINNGGNEVTQPILRVYGQFDTALIQNLNTAEQIDLDYSVANGEYIEIDTVNRTVKLDDGTSVFSAFDGEFLSLIPGDNEISLSVTNGDGATRLDVIYRDAYNGL